MTSRNLSELLESGWSGQLGDKVPAHARVSPCSVLSPDGWPSSDSSSPASPVLQPLHELRPAINAAKPQLKKGLRKVHKLTPLASLSHNVCFQLDAVPAPAAAAPAARSKAVIVDANLPTKQAVHAVPAQAVGLAPASPSSFAGAVSHAVSAKITSQPVAIPAQGALAAQIRRQAAAAPAERQLAGLKLPPAVLQRQASAATAAAAVPKASSYTEAQPAAVGLPTGSWTQRQTVFPVQSKATATAGEVLPQGVPTPRKATQQNAAQLIARARHPSGSPVIAAVQAPSTAKAASARPGLPAKQLAARKADMTGTICKASPAAAQQTNERQEQAGEAAWRWRFRRKWGLEQLRAYRRQFPDEPGYEDAWDDALAYMQACGGPNAIPNAAQAQPASQQSAFISAALAKSAAVGDIAPVASRIGTAMAGGVDDEMSLSPEAVLFDEEPVPGRAALSFAAGHAATASNWQQPLSRVNSADELADRAAELQRRQRSVEAQQPQPAWQKPTGQPTWVGELVPTFEVAGNGSNPYVILQITDSRTGNSRVIVRGRSGASEQQTLQQVQRQLAQIAAKHSLPLMAVELLAGGNLESRKGLASKAPTIFPIGVVW